jgi:NAD(P)-dependent dehydrogenase (short-subunit alcohol dehydrogenase family)
VTGPAGTRPTGPTRPIGPTGPTRPTGPAGRTALVTGAGNGLGRAITLALASEGARVICVGRTVTSLEETLALLPRPAPAGRFVTADVSRAESVAALAETVAGENVSILVNNAGIPGPVKPLTEISPEDWDEVFDVNVRGIYLMCRTFIPPMARAGGGDIINLASVSGKRPLIHRTPYVASKMAIIGLTRTLAFECGPLGISVNSLSPGPVRGPRMARNFALEAQQSGITQAQAERDFVSRAALNRLVEPDEVGAAVLAMLRMPGLCGADLDLSAGMIAP